MFILCFHIPPAQGLTCVPWFIKHNYAFYNVNLTPALKVNLYNYMQPTCLTGGREGGTPHFLTRGTQGVQEKWSTLQMHFNPGPMEFSALTLPSHGEVTLKSQHSPCWGVCVWYLNIETELYASQVGLELDL